MKKLLVSIFLLTLFDAVATYIGLKLGTMLEGNMLLRPFVTASPLLSLTLMVLFTGALLSLLWKDRLTTKHITAFVTGLLIWKVIVALSHILWIMEVL